MNPSFPVLWKSEIYFLLHNILIDAPHNVLLFFWYCSPECHNLALCISVTQTLTRLWLLEETGASEVNAQFIASLSFQAYQWGKSSKDISILFFFTKNNSQF